MFLDLSESKALAIDKEVNCIISTREKLKIRHCNNKKRKKEKKKKEKRRKKERKKDKEKKERKKERNNR